MNVTLGSYRDCNRPMAWISAHFDLFHTLLIFSLDFLLSHQLTRKTFRLPTDSIAKCNLHRNNTATNYIQLNTKTAQQKLYLLVFDMQ